MSNNIYANQSDALEMQRLGKGSWAEYSIYRQSGHVVHLCADHLARRQDCHDEDSRAIDEDDKLHRRGPTAALVQCHDCEDEVREAEPPVWP